MLHVGLDLSRKRLDYQALAEDGEPVDTGTAPPDADGLDSLARRIGRHGEPIHAAIQSGCGLLRSKRSRRGGPIVATRKRVSTSRTWRSSPRRATPSSPRCTTSGTKWSPWAAFGFGLRAASTSIQEAAVLLTGRNGKCVEARAWLSRAEALEAAGLQE